MEDDGITLQSRCLFQEQESPLPSQFRYGDLFLRGSEFMKWSQLTIHIPYLSSPEALGATTVQLLNINELKMCMSNKC